MAPGTPTSRVSVVIPAYREGAGITAMIMAVENALADAADDYEIIVVDDGSDDDTFERVRALAANDARIAGIRLSRRFGKEAALLAGLRLASGAAVITIDADMQHPPMLIPAMIRVWRAGAVVVNALKNRRTDESRFERFRATLFNRLVTRLSGIDMDGASDYKLLDRRAVDILVNSFPEKMRFYRGLTKWIGFPQTDLPFDCQPRRTGKSAFSTRDLRLLATTGLLSFTSAPLRVVTLLGTVTMLIGSVIAADAVRSWLRHESVSGFATTIITLLMIGSVIMISLGIIGEYIAKIYDEIKGRPAYLISRSCGAVRGQLVLFQDSHETRRKSAL